MDKTPTLNIYPVPQGIVLELTTPGDTEEDTVSQKAILSPDDAGRVAINLITTLSVMEIQQAMSMAAAREEFEKTKSLIEKGQNVEDIILPGLTKK